MTKKYCAIRLAIILIVLSVIGSLHAVRPVTAAKKLPFIGVVNDGTGLDGVSSMSVSPDGKHIYVAGQRDDAVAVFSRDGVTGGLTFVEVQKDGQNGVDGLDGAFSVTVSADGKHVYVAAHNDDAITYFGSFLFLNKMLDQANPQLGQRLTYRLTITNSGSLATSGGILSDALPSELNFVGPVTFQGGSGTPGTPPLIVTNLALPAGQTMTVSLPVMVSTEVVIWNGHHQYGHHQQQ